MSSRWEVHLALAENVGGTSLVGAQMGESLSFFRDGSGMCSGPFSWQRGKRPCRKIALFPRDVFSEAGFLYKL